MIETTVILKRSTILMDFSVLHQTHHSAVRAGRHLKCKNFFNKDIIQLFIYSLPIKQTFISMMYYVVQVVPHLHKGRIT